MISCCCCIVIIIVTVIVVTFSLVDIGRCICSLINFNRFISQVDELFINIRFLDNYSFKFFQLMGTTTTTVISIDVSLIQWFQELLRRLLLLLLLRYIKWRLLLWLRLWFLFDNDDIFAWFSIIVIIMRLFILSFNESIRWYQIRHWISMSNALTIRAITITLPT